MKTHIRIIFAGTPDVATYLLESLLKDITFKIVAVLTQPDKRQGRGNTIVSSAVNQYARSKNLVVFSPENLNDQLFERTFEQLNPDILLVANYAKIIPSNILAIPSKGCVCFHPSYLPFYRGTTPIRTALLENKKQTGLTFFKMDEKIDHGPIIYQTNYPILSSDTHLSLTEKLFREGAKVVAKVVQKYFNSILLPQPQAHSLATYTKKIGRDDGFIQGNEPLEDIWLKYRAYESWPGVWTVFKGKRVKITKMTKNTKTITIEKVLMEGKKEVTLSEFKNGYSDFNLFK